MDIKQGLERQNIQKLHKKLLQRRKGGREPTLQPVPSFSGNFDEPRHCQHPPAPYYAVIFTSLRTAVDEGYGDMAQRMVTLAAQQPGFLGVESARDGLRASMLKSA